MPLRKSTGCGGQKDAALRGELEHERPSKKARTNAASGVPWLGAVDAQPGAIGAGQLDLGHGGGLGPGGGGWHFDKAQGQRGRRRGRLVTGRHVFFEVCQAHPQVLGHA